MFHIHIAEVKNYSNLWKLLVKKCKSEPIYMKKIGSGEKKVWLVSGQHIQIETINSWILEGFVKRLMEKNIC